MFHLAKFNVLEVVLRLKPSLLLHRSRTVCQSRSGHLRRCKLSAAD